MKRKLAFFLVFIMVFALIPQVEVNAMNYDNIYEKELSNAVISGDGSTENPYVVNYEKAPHFKEYIDSINDKVMGSLQGNNYNNSISTRGIYDGILIGKKHTGQTNGASWLYGSGGPSTASNGNIWMKKVVYVPIGETKNIYNGLADSFYYGIVKDGAKTIAEKGYNEAYNYLLSKGISSALAKAVLKAAGKLNAVFSVVETLQFVRDFFTLTKYAKAVRDGDGMINASYATSYQGSWYQHYGEDSWTSAPIAYEPASYYGTGTYISYR